MNAQHIPGAQKKTFWQKKWPRELVYNGPPLIAAAIAVVKLAREATPDYWLMGLSVLGCLWLLIVTFMRISSARAEDAKEGPDVVHEGLSATVSTVHTMLTQYCSTRNCGGDIRATFHRVVPPVNDPEQIEQIINYAGSNGEGAGRHFPINAGITGRAIRKKIPVIMASAADNEDLHRTELVSEWGYTEAQARRLMSGRFSAVAVPVLGNSGQHAVGVFYLDSSDRALFDREDVMEIVGVGSQAISEFVTKRY